MTTKKSDSKSEPDLTSDKKFPAVIKRQQEIVCIYFSVFTGQALPSDLSDLSEILYRRAEHSDIVISGNVKVKTASRSFRVTHFTEYSSVG